MKNHRGKRSKMTWQLAVYGGLQGLYGLEMVWVWGSKYRKSHERHEVELRD